MFNRKSKKTERFDPDEIFLDSSNLPRFDVYQFEGRLEQPISKIALIALFGAFLCVALLFSARLFNLGIQNGSSFRASAEGNRLERVPLFAERGGIVDRNGEELAWNEPLTGEEFAARAYTEREGLAHALGFVSYPARDAAGVYYAETFEGKDGAEKAYDSVLLGKNGTMLVERDARGEVQSAHAQTPTQNGENIMLALDARMEEALFVRLRNLVRTAGFKGAAGVIMDVTNGDIIALASVPSYDSGVLTDGAERDEINALLADANKPFLNRVLAGQYTPGSIVKPFLAVAALQEQIISPEKEILSTGSISIPNPYFPDKESVFRDWKAHGLVNMREAIAVSSDVYFYEVGGGYKDQPGLGIGKIETYMRLFGFGEETGADISGEENGVIPTPLWKERIFGDDWRLGDTYITAIGQYGFQVTPLQVVRAVAALANGGKLLKPRFVTKIFSDKETVGGGKETAITWEDLPIDTSLYAVVREGMRLGVTEGTAAGLDLPFVRIAEKTGTAEVGTLKQTVHSWVTGFFPYEEPRYAFALVMERGPVGNPAGALSAFRDFLFWVEEYAPEYLN